MVTALVATKFYLLFSFLFGYSFTIQQRSAESAETAFAPRHLRRSAVLFLLGLAHAVLLLPGDILMTYAALGLVLFAFRAASPRTLLRVAAGLLGAVAVLFLAYGLLLVSTTEPVGPEAFAASASETVKAYRGGPGSVVAANARLLPDALTGDLLFAADILAAFLVGLAAGRWRALADPDRHIGRMKRIIRRGLPVGLAGGVFMAVCSDGPLDSRWFYVGRAAGILTAPALTASYACALLLLVRTRVGRRIGDALAPAGRMSLTNYLTQSLILALVFTGYGLGCTTASAPGSCWRAVSSSTPPNWPSARCCCDTLDTDPRRSFCAGPLGAASPERMGRRATADALKTRQPSRDRAGRRAGRTAGAQPS